RAQFRSCRHVIECRISRNGVRQHKRYDRKDSSNDAHHRELRIVCRTGTPFRRAMPHNIRPGEKPDDYVIAADDVAKVAVLMAARPGEVNLYEATILPNHMRSFIGRG